METKGKTGELRRILSISQRYTSTSNIEEVLELILSAATELTGAEAASIMLLAEAGGGLRFAATSARDREQLMSLRVSVVGSLAGSILSAGQPLAVEDV